jgi:L-rhamnose isomerase/sugar isomerase
VHRFTGCCPTVAVHVLWDFSIGVDAMATAELAKKHGVRIGSINPNFFQDQVYKFGSACNGDEDARRHAHLHMSDCIAIAKAVGSDTLSLWFADGTNYPG